MGQAWFNKKFNALYVHEMTYNGEDVSKMKILVKGFKLFYFSILSIAQKTLVCRHKVDFLIRHFTDGIVIKHQTSYLFNGYLIHVILKLLTNVYKSLF